MHWCHGCVLRNWTVPGLWTRLGDLRDSSAWAQISWAQLAPAHHCYSCPLPSLGLERAEKMETLVIDATVIQVWKLGKFEFWNLERFTWFAQCTILGRHRLVKPERQHNKQTDDWRRDEQCSFQRFPVLLFGKNIFLCDLSVCELEVKVDLWKLPWPDLLSNLPSYERQMQLKSCALVKWNQLTEAE